MVIDAENDLKHGYLQREIERKIPDLQYISIPYLTFIVCSALVPTRSIRGNLSVVHSKFYSI